MSLRRGSTRRSSKDQERLTLNVKCVILGDGHVGKSAMLLTFLTGKFPDESSPGPIDGLSEYGHLVDKPVIITHNYTEAHVTLVDTYGQDEYDKLRERACANADVYILCYDVSKPETFERARHHWLPEFRKYSAPDSPFIVAGLKTDLRTKALTEGRDMSEFITYTQGSQGSVDMGATSYVECSAKNNFAGVKKVFDKAAQAAATNALPDDLKRNSCVLS